MNPKVYHELLKAHQDAARRLSDLFEAVLADLGRTQAKNNELQQYKQHYEETERKLDEAVSAILSDSPLPPSPTMVALVRLRQLLGLGGGAKIKDTIEAAINFIEARTT